jgi:hypothetical protein
VVNCLYSKDVASGVSRQNKHSYGGFLVHKLVIPGGITIPLAGFLVPELVTGAIISAMFTANCHIWVNWRASFGSSR